MDTSTDGGARATRHDPVWDDGDWSPLAPLSGEVSADVCVVGLGGSGLSCIEALLADGKTVVGIDAQDVGSGAAGRNGGFLLAGTAAFHHDAVAQHGRERVDAIYRITMAELDRVFADMPEVARCTGSLRIACSEEEERDCELQLASMRESGLPAEPYDGPEGRGLLIPTDGVFDPMQRARLLARRALDGGAGLYGGTPAVEIAGREVRTPRGIVRCGRVVVAVDGRMEQLLPELSGEVRTARLQMLATAPVARRLTSRAVYLRYGYEYWQQLPDGRLAVGGFRDRGGDDEWTRETDPGDVVQRELDSFLHERLGLTIEVTHRWAASVAFSGSGLPYADEVRPGVWAIGAYSGTGNVLGTLLGRKAAESLPELRRL